MYLQLPLLAWEFQINFRLTQCSIDHGVPKGVTAHVQVR